MKDIIVCYVGMGANLSAREWKRLLEEWSLEFGLTNSPGTVKGSP